MTLAMKLLPLLAAVLLGALSGGLRLFPDPHAALLALNRYVLYVAFPLLMLGAIAMSPTHMPTEVGFYAAHVVLFLAAAAVVRLLCVRTSRTAADGGAVALGALFGNVVYLGLPVAAQVLGPAKLGTAAMSAAIHMLLALSLGPSLLLAWSGGARKARVTDIIRRVARQPLVWAPALGLVARALPQREMDAAWAVVAPLGGSAAPVALYLLGLYLWTHRSGLRRVGRSVALMTGAKLLLFPIFSFGIAAFLIRWGQISLDQGRVLVVLAGAPTAITTFAIAHEYATGEQPIAQGIVLSTALSVLTLPAVVKLAEWLPQPG